MSPRVVLTLRLKVETIRVRFSRKTRPIKSVPLLPFPVLLLRWWDILLSAAALVPIYPPNPGVRPTVYSRNTI